MTEPIKDSREALEEFPPEEIPDGNGPDLDNGPEDEQEDVSSKLKTLYEKVIAAAEEYHRVFFQSQEWAILQKEFPGITKDQAMAVSFIVDDIVDYMPELKEIIQEKEAEAGKPITISDLLEGIDLVNEETDTIGPFLLEDCLETAQELRRSRIPSVKTKQIRNINIPLDKVNSQIRLLGGPDFDKRLLFDMANEKDQENGIQVFITLMMDFEEAKKLGVRFSKDLNSYDQRVMQGIGAVFNESGPITSIRKIYHGMGNKGAPSKAQREKIYDSIRKMISATITIDNRREVARYKNYPLFTYEGPVLMADIITARIDGNITHEAIQIYREPALITFAKGRGQIATIEIKHLQNDIKKSKYYYPIEAYLLERILRARTGGQKSILMNTLYEKAGLNDRRRQYEARPTIKELLDFWKGTGLIRNYEMDNERIRFTIPTEKRIPEKTSGRKKQKAQ